MESLSKLLTEVRACQICAEHLPFPPKPVLRANKSARILIIGQAPGLKVQSSGIPWDDQSGVRLRNWMGIEVEDFYDEKKIAIIPMGFCYPGKGKSGDLPPRRECAPLWHARLLKLLPNLSLTILIGKYALDRYLGDRMKISLTETVKSFQEFAPAYLPIVHPSPRNQIWIQKNPWFEKRVVPYLKEKVRNLILNFHLRKN